MIIKKIICYFILFLTALILQSTAIDVISINNVRPDLILILVFIIAIKEGPLAGLLSGFLFGFMQDSYNPNLLGIHALAKAVIGYGLGFFGEKTVRTVYSIKLALALIAFLLHEIVASLLSKTLHCFLQVSIPVVVYTIVVTAAVLFLVENSKQK